MARPMKLEGLNTLILLEISKGNAYPSKIAKALKLTTPNLSQHLNSLEKKGYLKRQKKGILVEIGLTELGMQAIKLIPVGMENTLTKPIYFRVHDIALSLKLKDSVQPSDKQTLIANSRLVPMRNHIDLVLQEEGYKARLYPNSLTIILPDFTLPLTADLELATSSIMERLGEIVPKLEEKLNIKVIRLDKDTLKASLVNMHIALTNHKFAETINDKDEKLYVYDDNSILRVIVDKSHGLDEYEAIAPAYVVEDATKLAKLTKATITGAFDYEKEQLARQQLREDLAFFARNVNTHVEWMYQMLKANKEGKPMPRKPKPEDINQRRL